jgi:hypothetical protein
MFVTRRNQQVKNSLFASAKGLTCPPVQVDKHTVKQYVYPISTTHV